MKIDEDLARWELFLIIAIPNFEKRAELLEEFFSTLGIDSAVMKVSLYQVQGFAFCAGFIIQGDICTKAAPILAKRFLGRTLLECRNTCVAHSWRLAGPFFEGIKPNEQNNHDAI